MGTYYNEIRNRLILAAVNVNSTADECAATRENCYQFGSLIAFAEVLEELGHEVCFTKKFNVTNCCYSIFELKIDGEIVIENKNCIV